MRLQIAKLEMSKNIRTRDGARHFVTKITLPKASDVTPYLLKKKSVAPGDLKKWSKNHWEGGRPPSPPRGGALDHDVIHSQIESASPCTNRIDENNRSADHFPGERRRFCAKLLHRCTAEVYCNLPVFVRRASYGNAAMTQ